MNMLTTGQVATKASVSKRTVQDWATSWAKTGTGHGPRPYRLGPHVTRYRLDDVDAWLSDPAAYRARVAA